MVATFFIGGMVAGLVLTIGLVILAMEDKD